MKADICVIGAGSGGLSVAAAAAQLGRKVVLIEKGEMGGDCLNYGCVPSKALIAAARRAHAFRASAAFGIASAEPQIDAGRLFGHIRQVIAEIAPEDSQARFEGLGCKVIRAPARFTGPDAVEAGGETIHARRFVIATGSRAAIPPVPGLDGVPFLTNETLFSLNAIPRHLLILGGGPIGLEMAQAFRRLGAEVTVLEREDRLLTRDDPELAAIVEARLASEGIRILKGARIARALVRNGAPALELESGVMLEGTHLLIAAGRTPQLESLDLPAAQVESTPRGVTVDHAMRSSNPRIYAIGDAAGGLQFTHAANYHAGLVIRHALFRLPVRMKPEAVPWVTYTDPELAQLGLTEAEAARRGIPVTVSRWPLAKNDRARAMRETEGLIKIIASKRGRVLGAGIAGPDAGELLSAYSIAMGKGLKLRDLASPVIAYPTLAETGKRAAMSRYAGLAANPALRFALGLLARLP